MGKTGRTTIDINGRTYDAITGALVTSTSSPHKTPKQSKQLSGQSMDGVVRSSPSATHHMAKTAKTVHAKPKRSIALHRQAVARAQHAAHGHEKHTLVATTRPQHDLTIEHGRSVRATHISRSQSISKFAPGLSQVTEPRVIVSEPEDSQATMAAPAPSLSPKEELIAKHLAQIANVSHQAKKQPIGKRTKEWLGRSRHGALLASGLSATLLIGYVTYLNIPNMALRVAASRAGFEAQLPGYQPSGFRFSGPIAYQAGEITMQYSSNTDNRRYIIREKESSWDSQTLLDTHVSPQTGGLHATYQERGLIVYVYGGSSATWVNGGVWYTIEGNAGLTTEQLLKIAASL